MVLYRFPLLPQAQLSDPPPQGFAEYLLPVDHVLLLSEDVDVAAFERDPSRHFADRSDLELLNHLLPSNVAADSLQEVDINIVLGAIELLCPEDLISAREEVDLGAEDISEEGLKQLKENILQYDLRQHSSFEYDEALALLGREGSKFEDLHADYKLQITNHCTDI